MWAEPLDTALSTARAKNEIEQLIKGIAYVH